MKKIFKKNQFIVTLLAVLIAVAGYLNYADKLAKDNGAKEANNTYDDVYHDDSLLKTDGDILSLDADSVALENESATVSKDDGKKDDKKNEEKDESKKTADNEKNNIVKEEESAEPGAAVLTSGKNMSDFTMEARLNREQTRSKNKETLLEIINNKDLADEQKKEAVDAMVKLTEQNEIENNIETVLEAKGYSNVLVTISDKEADIIIDKNQVSKSDRAQIENVVTRKTNLSVDNIIITPMTE